MSEHIVELANQALALMNENNKLKRRIEAALAVERLNEDVFDNSRERSWKQGYNAARDELRKELTGSDKIKVWIEDKSTGQIIQEHHVTSREAVRIWIEAQKRRHGYQALLEPDETWRGEDGRLVVFKVRENSTP
jgi:hypothetical protein